LGERVAKGDERAVLVLFAKEPRPGKVKTRMSPPLSLEDAAELYRCLLADTIACSSAMARALALDFVVAIDPPEARDAFLRRVPEGTRILLQRGVDLSARLANAAADLAAEGAGPILMRGSDSPALALESVEAALTALRNVELVLCPDRDGGYNLIGLREPEAALFDLPMSSETLLERTLEVAHDLGLSTELLPTGFDLDSFEDLRHFSERSDREALRPLCPRTCAFVEDPRMLGLLSS